MHHSDFVHLHLHSQYSLLDGACRLKPLLEKAVEYKMPALAITDHGNMFGAVDFYTRCLQVGIKPIIGCEVYVAPGSRREKKAVTGPKAYHLVLLARDEQGYRNLCKLVSESYLNGFYYHPRIDKELLSQYSQGLLGMSACIKGEVPASLLKGDWQQAEKVAGFYREALGEGNFYLELQENGLPEQDTANQRIIELAGKLSLPLVATNDTHYLNKEDAYAHEILLCIQTGKTINDPGHMRFSTDEFYLKSGPEMHRLFDSVPEAIRNTVEIAERCNVEFDFEHNHLPHYQVPEGYDLETYLNKLSYDGLRERFPALKDKDISRLDDPLVNRLKEELQIMNDMGFPGYFLIVWDFIHYARTRKIAVGPGRGSAAGSLVAYCLKITDIDPIKHGLLFERFLNPERISLPDIDIDLCCDRRQEVIDYVRKKYGRENVAQIITFGTMAAKGVIRDVGRALDMPYAEVDKLAKLVPDTLNIKLADAIVQEPRLKEAQQNDSQVEQLVKTSLVLEGLTRHASIHAAGVVIAPKPVDSFVPLYKASGDGNPVVTQYGMVELEKIGLLKMDFLGLRTLTAIQNAINLIASGGKSAPDISEIPLDDPETYKLLCSARTLGVFQLESSGMRDLIRRLKPSCFDELVALVALFRPGPLGSGMVDDFIRRKHGEVKITYDHPWLEDILKETYGVIVYQEQVMKIASVMAGFTLGEADLLRRAMGKKKQSEMEKQSAKFIEGAVKKGVDKALAQKIFDLMAYFAGYGFNKSHSAAYALVSYQTAYLKARFPAEYMAALLSTEQHNSDKVVKYIAECREMGINVLPPDVNTSSVDFSVVGSEIRFGLAAVKNVGEGAAREIVKKQQEGEYRSLDEFCRRIDLRSANRRVLESLIKCGAFDSLGKEYRSQYIQILDRCIELGQKSQKDRAVGQKSLFELMAGPNSTQKAVKIPDIPEWHEFKLLTYEKESLGFYLSGHPLASYDKDIKKFATHSTAGLSGVSEGKKVKVAGIISSLKEITTKKGERMAFVGLEDLEGIVEVVILPNIFSEALEMVKSDKPVLVSGEINAKGDQIKIKATQVKFLTEVRETIATKACLHISLPGLTEKILYELQTILLEHPGNCQVYLKMVLPMKYEAVIEAGNAFRVAASEELIQNVNQLLGNRSVSFE
ncbi:MAG: DNA polymerase III subunit alpha [bacterium]